MENKYLPKSEGRLISILAISIPLVVFILILNWFFKITSYQKFQGMPLMIAPFISVIGLILSFVSLKKSHNIIVKWSIAINAILFVSPFLYWFLGTLFLGV